MSFEKAIVKFGIDALSPMVALSREKGFQHVTNR